MRRFQSPWFRSIPAIALTFVLLFSFTACSTGSPSSPELAAAATPQSSPVIEVPTATATPRPTRTPFVLEGVGRVITTVELSSQGGLFPVFGAGAVWVPGPALLTRIDPVTAQVVAEIPLDDGTADRSWPYAVAAEGENIWATERGNRAVVRIDPQTNEVVDRIQVEGELHALAVDGDSVWVADVRSNNVLRVDIQTKQIVARIPVAFPTSIEIGAGSVWVVEHDKGNVVRIDPNTNSVLASIPLGQGGSYPGDAAFGEGSLWVGDLDSGMVLRVDPETNEVIARIATQVRVIGLEAGAGAIWAAVGEEPAPGQCKNSGAVRIDPQTNTAAGRIPVRCAGDIALSPEGLWVTSFAYPEVTLIQPED